MSLQFLIGKATADRQNHYIEDIEQVLQEKPEASIFVLVPEHAKFEAEMTVLQDLWRRPAFASRQNMGSINLQVFSFSRLAWFFLRDEEIYLRKQLSDAGLSMLIRKILLDKEQELVLYRKEVDKEGFVVQLTSLFKELWSGRITSSDLRQSALQGHESIRQFDFQQKMAELSFLYEEFSHTMAQGYLQYESVLERLAEALLDTPQEETYVYIDGFHRFSAQEMQIIASFLARAEKVTISLVLDKGCPDQVPGMENLFYTSGSTYKKIYDYARSQGIPILRDVRIQKDTDGFAPGLVELDAYWRRTSSGTRLPREMEEDKRAIQEAVEVWSCASRQTEIFHVANSINRLVADKQYRYRDFLILTRRLEDYETFLRPMFEKAGLEVFYDKAETMSHHPFTDFLDSLFRIRHYHWRYADVMRLLRTELLVPDRPEKSRKPAAPVSYAAQKERAGRYRDMVDQTENILIAYGFEGNDWLRKEDWKAFDFEVAALDEEERTATGDIPPAPGLEEANRIKDFLQRTLQPFFRRMQRAKTGRDAAAAVYQFLERSGVSEQMLYWRDAALEEHDLERARQHEQVWKTFVSLLDEYVETLGEMPFDPRTFHEIIMTGFETATFSIVPPAIDQVIFSSLESARFQAAKVVYLIGMTQDNLPMVHENRSLLTNEEREQVALQLTDGDKYLHPSPEESTAAEPFLAYQAFLSGTDRLFFTYPVSVDGNSQATRLSPYVQRIVAACDIPIQRRAADVTEAVKPSNFAGTKEQNIGQLVHLLRDQLRSQKELPYLWRQILSYLYADSGARRLMTRVFAGIWRKNIPAQLTPEIAQALYGTDLSLSVSQLESYYEDSYSHFLQYGLRLKERQRYELSAAGTGEFFHEALQYIVREMRQGEQLSEAEIRQLTDRVLQSLYGKEKYAILSSSNRMNFIKDQLGETIGRMTWILHHHRARTAFKNLRTEAVFGQPQFPSSLKGLEIPLENDHLIRLRGKIDRIDAVEADGRQLLSVLDYKSSQHTFKFAEAYYGLAMQMITYLDVALLNAEGLLSGPATPAGAFYLHVKNPFLKVEQVPAAEEWEKQILKDNKLRGILVKDESITGLLDPQAERSGESLVLPFAYKNDGSLREQNDLVTLEELRLLIANNRRRIQEAGNSILSGELKLNPIRDRQFTPSVQGPYRAVSQFDATLPENRYRRLEPLKKKEVLDMLQLELDLDFGPGGQDEDGKQQKGGDGTWR